VTVHQLASPSRPAEALCLGVIAGALLPLVRAIEVVEVPPAPLQGPAPQIAIVSPLPSAKALSGRVLVAVRVVHWPAAGGDRVDLFVDDEPAIPIPDASRPVDLEHAMQAHLGHGLSRGSHVLRAVPVHASGESVKEGRPVAWSWFHFEEKTPAFSFDPTEPMLTWGRPEGCRAPGEPVLLDFALSNVDLSPSGARVRWTIDRDWGEIVHFAPHRILGLAPGDHAIQVALTDANGVPLSGRFVEGARTFTVASTCPAPHGDAPPLDPLPLRPGPAMPPLPEAD